jgi:hypothetical protein
MFRPIRRVSARLIAAFYVLDIALVLAAVTLFSTDLLDGIERSSKGLVNVTLVVNLAIIVLVV